MSDVLTPNVFPRNVRFFRELSPLRVLPEGIERKGSNEGDRKKGVERRGSKEGARTKGIDFSRTFPPLRVLLRAESIEKYILKKQHKDIQRL